MCLPCLSARPGMPEGMEDGTICAMDFDFLFRGATVFDGTGAKAFQADVGVRGETIAAIGDLSAAEARESRDAQGLWLMPGLIDAHTHSDAFLLLEPMCPSKLAQGVTTEIGGQCGGSAAPRLNGARLPSDWEAQTYPPLEILVGDDGSTDRTAEIAAGYGDAGKSACGHRASFAF